MIIRTSFPVQFDSKVPLKFPLLLRSFWSVRKGSRMGAFGQTNINRDSGIQPNSNSHEVSPVRTN